ncbi:MAG: hypothetical protein ABSE62_05040 [Chthoniobacteraceae bacterium]|jgi:chromosome segregation ATPase
MPAPTVPQLTARITELEGQLSTANQRADKGDADLKIATEASTKLTTDLTTANQRADKADADLKVATDASAKLTTDLDASKLSLAEANTAKTTAETNLKTSDDRAELKVRELYAANGLVLPKVKATVAGEVAATDPALTPRQRLAAGFKAQGEAVAA